MLKMGWSFAERQCGLDYPPVKGLWGEHYKLPHIEYGPMVDSERGRPTPIYWMHLKTSKNFAQKSFCIIF